MDYEFSDSSVTVIGAGIAGCLTALELARLGFHVNIIEARSDIMLATSGSNAAREHTGPHYPADLDTGLHSLFQTTRFHLLMPGFRRNDIEGTKYYIPTSPDEQHVDPDTFIRNMGRLQEGYTSHLAEY